MPDLDIGNVLDAYWRPLLFRDDHSLDVTLRERARPEQANASDVVTLLAQGQPLSADVLV